VLFMASSNQKASQTRLKNEEIMKENMRKSHD
jgi:hypothetical protein